MANKELLLLKKDIELKKVSEGVFSFLETQKGLVTQLLECEDGSFIIQGRVKGFQWKRFVGMDEATTVCISVMGRTLSVTVGGEKWLDKTVALYPPLFTFAALGTARQAMLSKEIITFISNTYCQIV